MIQLEEIEPRHVRDQVYNAWIKDLPCYLARHKRPDEMSSETENNPIRSRLRKTPARQTRVALGEEQSEQRS